MRGFSWLAVALVFAAGTSLSCRQEPEVGLFAQGETLYLDGRYDEAIAVFKRFLLEHPDHAGAHFYLGTCYLSSDANAWLGIAQGELQTALALFERQGKVNPIKRFSSATYFEMICHINQAKIYMNLMLTVMEDPPTWMRRVDPRAAMAMLLEKCEEQYEAARHVDPSNPDVEGLRKQIDMLRGALQIPARPPDTPSAVPQSV